MSEARPELRHTPLEEEHRRLGARLSAFAGWLMPITYRGTLTEHEAVRGRVGLFDLTHLGKIDVLGPGALQTLQRAMPNDLSRVPAGGAQYNMVLNERGGIVDDLINYRVADERFLCVPNAANVGTVHAAILSVAAPGTDVVLRDDLALIAPQGPSSFELAAAVFPDAPALQYMHCGEMDYRGTAMVVSRSGYTGERGLELFVPEHLAVELWRDLLSRGKSYGLEPCGLGARDTLRLEMGYPLHGNDIWDERTPLEAGLSWAVAMDKETDFVGRDALARQRREGIRSRLWGLRMKDRLIPRPHYPVLVGSERVGETTSGTFSPTLRIGIGMAYLSPLVAPGDQVEVDVRGRRGLAGVVRPPFVDSSPK